MQNTGTTERKLKPPSLYAVYIDAIQYQKWLEDKREFYLIFELSKKNRKSLLTIVQECLEYKHFLGMIFVVEKNELLFERLFYIKTLALKLLDNDKSTGVWGVPYCVMQSIFGPCDYSHYASGLIPQTNEIFSKYIPTYRKDSSLLIKCAECICVSDCDGLGSRTANHHMWDYRTSHTYRTKERDILFKTEQKEMQKIYDLFCNHIDQSDLSYADRYLYFVKNIDFGSPYSFAERFVYHCDFLPHFEYEKEFDFLSQHIKNRDLLPRIRFLAEKEEICRLGYSKAVNENIHRESLYINPRYENSYYLLEFFDVEIERSFPNKFFGVGVDFFNGEIKSYKIYFVVHSEILLQMRPHYFKKIGIDIDTLHQKEHYFIVRLNADKESVSERIDLIYNERDHLHYARYFEQALFPNENMKKIHPFAFAFEFEKDNIKKINIYYRNRF